jgi:hypothetical protein
MNTVCFVIENACALSAEHCALESIVSGVDCKIWSHVSLDAAIGAGIAGAAADQLACRVRFSSTWPASNADFMVADHASTSEAESSLNENECIHRAAVSNPIERVPLVAAIRPLGLAQNRIAACFAHFVGIAVASSACASFTAIVADNKQAAASHAVARVFEIANRSSSSSNALRVFTVLSSADECVRAEKAFASRVCACDRPMSFSVSQGKLSALLRSVRDASAVADVSADLIRENSPVAGVMVDFTDLTVAKSAVTMRTAARWRDIVAIFECISSAPVSCSALAAAGTGLRFADQWMLGIQYNMAGSDTGLPWVDADIDWLRGGVVANARPHGWTVEIASVHTFVSGHVKCCVNFVVRRTHVADHLATSAPAGALNAGIPVARVLPDDSTWPPAPIHPEWRELFAWDPCRAKIATREVAKYQWAAAHFSAAFHNFGRDLICTSRIDRPRIALSEPGFMCALPALIDSSKHNSKHTSETGSTAPAIICMTVDDDVQRADIEHRLHSSDLAASHAEFHMASADSIEVTACDTRGAAGAPFWFLCCAGGDAMFREHWWTPLTAWFQRILRDANADDEHDSVLVSSPSNASAGNQAAAFHESSSVRAGGILSFMIATPDGPAVNALIADICALAMQQSEINEFAASAAHASSRAYLSLSEAHFSPLVLASKPVEIVPSSSPSSPVSVPSKLLQKRPVHSRKWNGKDAESAPSVGHRATFLCACIHQTLVTLRVSISYTRRDESAGDDAADASVNSADKAV